MKNPILGKYIFGGRGEGWWWGGQLSCDIDRMTKKANQDFFGAWWGKDGRGQGGRAGLQGKEMGGRGSQSSNSHR